MTTDLDINEIKTAFAQLQSKEDLLNLLNRVKPSIYGKNAVPFELKQLTWYSNPKLGPRRYREFLIKKKSGENRSIHAPVNGLKAIQKCLSLILQCVFEPHRAATGFIKSKSIVDNAAHHQGSKYVYNIDLKDFFPSIDQARVWKCLQLRPFNLTNGILKSENDDTHLIKTGVRKFVTEFGESIFYKIKDNSLILIIDKKGSYKKYKDRLTHEIVAPKVNPLSLDIKDLNALSDYHSKVNKIIFEDAKRFILSKKNIEQLNRLTSSRLMLANMIAAICCTEMLVDRKNSTGVWEKIAKNVLPQGAPTSPVITNIVCQRLDFLLSAVAKRFGLKYSRYADDITFSSMHNVYQSDSDFIKELHRIIAEQGFHIKESKTRLQKDGYRKEVTGLLVNDKVNVQKRYIKQLRMWLYYWECYGYEKAYSFFLQQYLAEKGHVKRGKSDMANVISGKLDYLKMVKGGESELYLKLRQRFGILTDTSQEFAGIKLVKGNELKNHINIIWQETAESPQKDTLKQIQKVQMENSPIPIIHTPKDLVSLLKNFSINDSALKYTTHSWDAGRDANMFKDLSEFLAMAKEQYNGFSFQLNSLSRNLNGKISNFLFNKNISEAGWGDPNPAKRIRFGWSSPELIEACRLDSSLNPEDFILPEKFQLQRAGKTIQKFKHVIDVFKNEIEIRDEDSALLNLILQKHDTFLLSFADPTISGLDNKTFYTDVQWLSKALDLIFENIQKRPQHRHVTYSMKDNGKDTYLLEITHVDSANLGKSIYDEKLRLTKGNFGDIAKYLKNICDWSVESNFTEGCYRINYLVSDQEIPARQKIESTPGFKHILTFYK